MIYLRCHSGAHFWTPPFSFNKGLAIFFHLIFFVWKPNHVSAHLQLIVYKIVYLRFLQIYLPMPYSWHYYDAAQASIYQKSLYNEIYTESYVAISGLFAWLLLNVMK